MGTAGRNLLQAEQTASAKRLRRKVLGVLGTLKLVTSMRPEPARERERMTRWERWGRRQIQQAQDVGIVNLDL
jgi:hypothetical protein